MINRALKMFRIIRQRRYKATIQFCKRGLVYSHTVRMKPNAPFEEESLPGYSPGRFYPVTVGEVLNSTYKVLGKLGYGAQSTVWLCRNIRYTI